MNRLMIGRAIGVLSQLSGIALLLTSSWLIVRAAEQPPVLYLMVAIVSVRFFGLARAALRYVERLLTHDAALAMVTAARVEVYRDLERLAPVGMTGRRRGDLVSRVVSDVDALQDRVLRLRGPWIVSLLSAVAVVALVAWIDPVSGAVVGGCAAGAMALIRLVVPWASRTSRAAAASWRGDLAAEVSLAALTAPDLVAYDAGHLVSAPAHDRISRLAAAERRGAWVNGLGQAIVLVSTGIAVSVVAALSGGVDPVLVGVVVLAPLALAEPLDALAEAERLRPGIEAAIARLDELAEAPESVSNPATPVALPDRFDLGVEDLAVGWQHPVAEGITFDLAQGDVIALTGPSGAGKSTVALTLARMLEPLGGRVLLGGVDLRELAATDVRSRVGLLAQDELVFDTSLRENLRIADPAASDSAMQAALDRAGLGDFVRGLPDGLDTEVGEGGARLSGGERQRLCLARLVLADHQVLVLDEPTEHLDRRAAEALIDDVLALAPSRSIVVVTHADWVVERIGRSVTLSATRTAVPA